MATRLWHEDGSIDFGFYSLEGSDATYLYCFCLTDIYGEIRYLISSTLNYKKEVHFMKRLISLLCALCLLFSSLLRRHTKQRTRYTIENIGITIRPARSAERHEL